jgi:hypothetical protein
MVVRTAGRLAHPHLDILRRQLHARHGQSAVVVTG